MARLRQKLGTIFALFTLFHIQTCQEAFVSTKTNPNDGEESNQDVNYLSINDGFRLPKSLVPESYNIKYNSIDLENFNFSGSVRIRINVMEKTKEIVLHSGKINTTVLSVFQVDPKVKDDLVIDTTNYNTTTETFSILMKKHLVKGSVINVNLRFDGIVRDDMVGIYKSSYFDKNGKQKWLVATHFSRINARHAFPCFDEPALKANFNISIQVPSGYSCLGNMPSKIDRERQWCKFESTVRMSTYLIAFVISDFEAIYKVNSTNLPMNVWARSNVVNQGEYALDIGRSAVQIFEAKFEEEYQLPKLDMVAIPDFAGGAMENWGLVTFREKGLLYHESVSSDADKQRVASLVVHEISHMWFGNLVTPEWWSYRWLSEGFATYFEYMTTNEIETSWKMDQQFVVKEYQLALDIDSYEEAVPMTREMITQQDINKSGGTITYAKGASIIRMMEHAFGTDVFDRALRIYLKDNKYDSTAPDRLWSAFQRAIYEKQPNSGLAVASIMKRWTEKPGYPYVNVTVKGDKIILEQERFFLRKPDEISGSTIWMIPITFRSSSQNTDDSTKPQYWLEDDRKALDNPFKNDDWFILNVQSAGYYRVNYDRSSWDKIIKVLTSGEHEKIHVVNRAAILDDLLSLARAELVDYGLALTAVSYLRNEKDYLPFKSAMRGLDHLRNMFSTSFEDRTFKLFVRSILAGTYRELTFNDMEADDQMKTMLRHEIIDQACKVDQPECIYRAQQQFSDWRTNQTAVLKNRKSTVYCTAIKYGSSDDWEFLWKQYLKSEVPSEQELILSSLGCSKNTTILNNYFLSALKGFEDSRIRKQDVSTVFNGVYSSSFSGARFTLDFIQQNHKEMKKYFKSNSEIEKIIKVILNKYPCRKIVDQVEKMMNEIPNLEDIKENLKRAVKLAESDIEWFKRNSKNIINWIKADRNGDGFENTKAYRLPENVIPTSYAIHLTPYIEPEKFNFTGWVDIHAEVMSSTDMITLHSDQLDISTDNLRISCLNDPNKQFKVLNVSHEEKYQFLNIRLDKQILKGAKISILIHYKGNLTTSMRGLYRSSYRINNGTRWLAATHLEPTAARMVFPCFDEPALKATFNISVEAPRGFSVMSNEERVASGSDDTWIFQTTPKMSTYLVAIVVSDFESEGSFNGERSYRVWGNPVAKKYKQLKYALEVMDSSVSFFEEKFGIPYELPKMDMVALPDFRSGAMENWGLLTYRETGLLYNHEYVSPVTSKQSIRNVISHEITHQWFGDLVSPLWWDYLWLSEGFARYFQYHAYNKNETSWNLENQFVVDHLQMSFGKDASKSTHSVTANVYSPAEIRDIFDSISYGKTASLIRMLEKLVGQEIFYKALSNYLESCKHSTGAPELLFKAFQDEMKNQEKDKFDVAEVMNSWTTQPGFPVLSVNFSYDSEKVHLSQSRFHLRPPANETDKSTWIIPINWATKSDPNFDTVGSVIWMENENVKEISFKRKPDDWVILNIQQTGYYRVNYDNVMWRRIIDTLLSESYLVIHEVNRASLIDDLFNLGRVGLVDYDIVFSAYVYLRNEKEYVPWKAALTNLNHFQQRFMGRPEIYDHFKNFVVHLLEPLYSHLKFDDAIDDSHTKLLLRKMALEWLCDLGFEDCVKESLKLFDNYRKGINIPPNKRATVYSTAVKYGESENWDYLWEKFKIADNATEKGEIMDALTYSSKPTLLKKLLSSASKEGTEVRLQDADKVFTKIVNNVPVGVETTLDFIADNYLQMREYFGGDGTTRSILKSIGLRLTTSSSRKKFRDIVKKSPKTMPSIAKSLQSYLKRYDEEMNWYSKYGSQIFRWLDRYEPINQDPTSNYRLPTSVVPETYDIFLQPFIEENDFTFVGNSTIDVKILQNTFKIELHYDKLHHVELEVTPATYQVSDIRKYDEATNKMTIYFEQLLTAGKNLQLKFKFTGILGDDNRGFYRSYYFDGTGKKRWIAATQFESIYARRAFPCFDEPSFKANFTIHIAKPRGYNTLSNMGSYAVEQRVGDIDWDHYEPSPKMSTYTLAFIVSDFNRISVPGSNVAMWGRKDLQNYLPEASTIGHESLKQLNHFTLIPYPLKEMNMVAVPDFESKAMENWGLITYREMGLIYDESKMSAQDLEMTLTTIVHEIAHMWFGNLVTCEWWDHLWLNEGFASFFQMFVSDKIKPDWTLMEQFVATKLQVAMASDSSDSSRAISNKVLTPEQISGNFDSIAYAKGASLLRMFYKSFGWWVFSEAVHNYLDARKYSTARPEHLIEAFQARVDYWGIMGNPPKTLDAKTIMESWLSQPGYPVVNATRKKNIVTLTQERFLMHRDYSVMNNARYEIPITYTSESALSSISTDPKLWFGSATTTFDLPDGDDWYLLNIDEVGYYRVNYDKTNWDKLIQLLNSDQFTKLSVPNRAQIIDDSLNLARAGYIDFEIAFRATQYLTRETNYVPWQSFFIAMDYVASRVRGNGEIEQLFANYMRSLIKGPFVRYGFEENLLKDNHTAQLSREIILKNACKYGHEGCKTQSKSAMDQKKVTPNIAQAVYCSHIEHGSDEDWNGLWMKFNSPILPTDQYTLIGSLGCSKNSTVLKRYLDLIVSPNSVIRKHDLDYAFKSVYSSSQIGLMTAMEYFEDNLEKLNKRYGNWDKVGSLFVSLSDHISTAEQLKKFDSFVKRTTELEIKSSLRKALETANRNLKWFEQYSGKISSWLKTNYPTPIPPGPKPDNNDDDSNLSTSGILILVACFIILGGLILGLTLWYRRSTT
ncbi:hypothetical protein QAD02_017746 [Eretmocerus hayati]|uniref:Uncharacterized protein n=1 Tax=Eretmocerus hayati TaxID=131215 RepID=A0ACC2PEG0_9HYME|nr:hypothetical protein QAD02_017746 [Eretmocerus hayati]